MQGIRLRFAQVKQQQGEQSRGHVLFFDCDLSGVLRLTACVFDANRYVYFQVDYGQQLGQLVASHQVQLLALQNAGGSADVSALLTELVLCIASPSPEFAKFLGAL